MRAFAFSIAALLFSTLLCCTATASAYTHFWTVDRTEDGIGLVGIRDGPGMFRTQVNYGSDPVWDHFWIPMHIYAVVSLLNIPIIALVVFYVCRRYRCRDAPSTA